MSRAPGTARSVTPGDGETAPREPAGAVRDAVRSAAADGPALAAFLTAGFPAPDRFVDTLRSVASEADVVEVGVPFSDPMADGLTIQRASRAALEAGVTLPWILEGIRSARPAAPVLLMSYLNPLLARGLGTLAEEAAAAGVGGLIVPDLPWEESGELREAVEPRGLGLVQMVTPVTPPDRLVETLLSGENEAGAGNQGDPTPGHRLSQPHPRHRVDAPPRIRAQEQTVLQGELAEMAHEGRV